MINNLVLEFFVFLINEGKGVLHALFVVSELFVSDESLSRVCPQLFKQSF